MSERITETPAEAEPQPDTATAAMTQTPVEQDLLVEEDLLVEDVSIDGMCGVY